MCFKYGIDNEENKKERIPGNHIQGYLNSLFLVFGVKKKVFGEKQKFSSVLRSITLVSNERDQTSVFISFALTVSGNLVHFSNRSLEQCCFGAVAGQHTDFHSLHKIYVRLRSGDWLGHSRPFRLFYQSHYFVSWLCLGSMRCWKTQPPSIVTALTDGRRFWPKISPCIAPFILPET